MRALLVEDDSATAQTMELMMKSEGINVYTTDLGEEAIDLGKIYDYDIILLDLNLPDMHGLDVLKALRSSKINTPVMIVTGSGDIDTKVKSFGGGADDYMTKPFHKDELIARVHSVIRRSKGHSQAVINIENVALNLNGKTVEVDGMRVHLTGKEYMMMELLALRKGTTLTKEMFLNHLYGGMDEPELKIIDVFICKLRKKLEAAGSRKGIIETVWGRGYVLRDLNDGVEPAIKDKGTSSPEWAGMLEAKSEEQGSIFRGGDEIGEEFAMAHHGNTLIETQAKFIAIDGRKINTKRINEQGWYILAQLMERPAQKIDLSQLAAAYTAETGKTSSRGTMELGANAIRELLRQHEAEVTLMVSPNEKYIALLPDDMGVLGNVSLIFDQAALVNARSAATLDLSRMEAVDLLPSSHAQATAEAGASKPPLSYLSHGNTAIILDAEILAVDGKIVSLDHTERVALMYLTRHRAKALHSVSSVAQNNVTTRGNAFSNGAMGTGLRNLEARLTGAGSDLTIRTAEYNVFALGDREKVRLLLADKSRPQTRTAPRLLNEVADIEKAVPLDLLAPQVAEAEGMVETKTLETIYQLGNTVFAPEGPYLAVDGVLIDLNPSEARVLSYLFEHRGEHPSKASLVENIISPKGVSYTDLSLGAALRSVQGKLDEAGARLSIYAGKRGYYGLTDRDATVVLKAVQTPPPVIDMSGAEIHPLLVASTSAIQEETPQPDKVKLAGDVLQHGNTRLAFDAGLMEIAGQVNRLSSLEIAVLKSLASSQAATVDSDTVFDHINQDREKPWEKSSVMQSGLGGLERRLEAAQSDISIRVGKGRYRLVDRETALAERLAGPPKKNHSGLSVNEGVTVKALLKKTPAPAAVNKKLANVTEVLQHGNTRLMLEASMMDVSGQLIKLSAVDVALLQSMLAKPGYVFEREMLVNAVNGMVEEPWMESTLVQGLSVLESKLEKNGADITTRVGRGQYKLSDRASGMAEREAKPAKTPQPSAKVMPIFGNDQAADLIEMPSTAAFNKAAGRLIIDGAAIDLNPAEAAIIQVFTSNPYTIFSQADLKRAVLNAHSLLDPKNIGPALHTLDEKLKHGDGITIMTDRARYYRLSAPVAASPELNGEMDGIVVRFHSIQKSAANPDPFIYKHGRVAIEAGRDRLSMTIDECPVTCIKHVGQALVAHTLVELGVQWDVKGAMDMIRKNHPYNITLGEGTVRSYRSAIYREIEDRLNSKLSKFKPRLAG